MISLDSARSLTEEACGRQVVRPPLRINVIHHLAADVIEDLELMLGPPVGHQQLLAALVEGQTFAADDESGHVTHGFRTSGIPKLGARHEKEGDTEPFMWALLVSDLEVIVPSA